ncbi:Zinc finger protein [Temnothorax longispinosus]|uniref:Zinc finger protein n=1 Tax=Temnothorax longispinosus TaxID=300112 RepID=A0A4S2KLW1_9HYME|nr:Zinc finger protein [Temnothorax longispinosus]
MSMSSILFGMLFVRIQDSKESTLHLRKRVKNTKRMRGCAKFSCPNPNCQSAYTCKNNLQTHIRYHCGQKPRFKCPYCDYMSKFKKDIRRHIQRLHKNHYVYVINVERNVVC